jgi:hypothetical protein
MSEFSDVERTLLFVVLCICLGARFIAAFWELEQPRLRWNAKPVESASQRLAAFRRIGDRTER